MLFSETNMQLCKTKSLIEFAAALALFAPAPWAHAVAFGHNPATSYAHRAHNQSASTQRSRVNSSYATDSNNHVRCTNQDRSGYGCLSRNEQNQQPGGTR